MGWTKNRSNKNVVKLLKQIESSRMEQGEYGAPPIRHKAYQGVIKDLVHWDTPRRSDASIRSWKKHRGFQHKM